MRVHPGGLRHPHDFIRDSIGFAFLSIARAAQRKLARRSALRWAVPGGRSRYNLRGECLRPAIAETLLERARSGHWRSSRRGHGLRLQSNDRPSRQGRRLAQRCALVRHLRARTRLTALRRGLAKRLRFRVRRCLFRCRRWCFRVLRFVLRRLLLRSLLQLTRLFLTRVFFDLHLRIAHQHRPYEAAYAMVRLPHRVFLIVDRSCRGERAARNRSRSSRNPRSRIRTCRRSGPGSRGARDSRTSSRRRAHAIGSSLAS